MVPSTRQCRGQVSGYGVPCSEKKEKKKTRNIIHKGDGEVARHTKSNP